MTLSTLQSAIVQGGSEYLDLKSTTIKLEGAMRTFCAFASKAGGKELDRIRNNVRVICQSVGDMTVKVINLKTIERRTGE